MTATEYIVVMVCFAVLIATTVMVIVEWRD